MIELDSNCDSKHRFVKYIYVWIERQTMTRPCARGWTDSLTNYVSNCKFTCLNRMASHFQGDGCIATPRAKNVQPIGMALTMYSTQTKWICRSESLETYAFLHQMSCFHCIQELLSNFLTNHRFRHVTSAVLQHIFFSWFIIVISNAEESQNLFMNLCVFHEHFICQSIQALYRFVRAAILSSLWSCSHRFGIFF